MYSVQDFPGLPTAFSARALAELGGCVLDAGARRQGSLVLVVNLCWTGSRARRRPVQSCLKRQLGPMFP